MKTAEQIAAELEAHARLLLRVAALLRGDYEGRISRPRRKQKAAGGKT